MIENWENGSQLRKWLTLAKMGNTWKTESHLEKWVTLGKKGHVRNKGHT